MVDGGDPCCVHFMYLKLMSKSETFAKRMTDGEGLHVIEGYSLAEVHDRGINHE